MKPQLTATLAARDGKVSGLGSSAHSEAPGSAYGAVIYHIYAYVYAYVYVYMCMCVCVISRRQRR